MAAPAAAALGAPSAEGLYVHVPFCLRRCHYCDFYTLKTPDERDAPDADRYLAALRVELDAIPSGFRPRTVFIGGGTPTELAPKDLARLLAHIGEAVDLSALEEWTSEANPGTLTREKLRLLLDAGVNRLSLGVQSFDAANLRFLGRIHGPDEAREAVRLARAEGVTNLSIDLIAAIPGSSADRLEADLREAAALGVEHLSCYALIFEEGTPLWNERRAGRVRPVPEEEEVRQYARVHDVLDALGFEPYEISNWARAGEARDLRCQHNLLYWGPGEFFAVGPGAHGHVGRARYGNKRDLERWAAALLEGRPAEARAFEERLDAEAWAREVLVVWLRRTEGVPLETFERATGFAARTLSGEGIARMEAAGLLEQAADRLRLTRRGWLLSDTVFCELV